MGRIADEVTHRAEVAVDKMEGASTSIEQARIVADLGVECSMMAALLCDDLSDRVRHLEAQVGALETIKKKKGKKKGDKKVKYKAKNNARNKAKKKAKNKAKSERKKKSKKNRK
jgi:hypothetical protein